MPEYVAGCIRTDDVPKCDDKARNGQYDNDNCLLRCLRSNAASSSLLYSIPVHQVSNFKCKLLVRFFSLISPIAHYSNAV